MLKPKTQAPPAVATTAEQGTQEAPAQTSAGSHTAQEFDISQGDAPMDVEAPHVEDRRTQLLEQEHEALLRQREQYRMVAERRVRLMESQYNEHLASLTLSLIHI